MKQKNQKMSAVSGIRRRYLQGGNIPNVYPLGIPLAYRLYTDIYLADVCNAASIHVFVHSHQSFHAILNHFKNVRDRRENSKDFPVELKRDLIIANYRSKNHGWRRTFVTPDDVEAGKSGKKSIIYIPREYKKNIEEMASVVFIAAALYEFVYPGYSFSSFRKAVRDMVSKRTRFEDFPPKRQMDIKKAYYLALAAGWQFPGHRNKMPYTLPHPNGGNLGVGGIRSELQELVPVNEYNVALRRLIVEVFQDGNISFNQVKSTMIDLGIPDIFSEIDYKLGIKGYLPQQLDNYLWVKILERNMAYPVVFESPPIPAKVPNCYKHGWFSLDDNQSCKICTLLYTNFNLPDGDEYLKKHYAEFGSF